MNETEALLSEIQAYLDASGVASSTFGRLAVNDGKLVARLRKGGSVTLTIASKVRAYIATHPAAEARSRSPFPIAGDAA